jgi:hypothetical protein
MDALFRMRVLKVVDSLRFAMAAERVVIDVG